MEGEHFTCNSGYAVLMTEQRPRKRRASPARKRVSAKASAALAAPALEEDLNADRLIHTAAVRAGAGAALHYVLDSLPLLKPFIPTGLRRTSAALQSDQVQTKLIRDIYAQHKLKPARWEVDAVLAVAQSQGVMTPLATRAGVQTMVSAWLPARLAIPLVRYSPLEPLITATARAVSATWAAGRYADGVCKIRRAGADWLPAPLTDALRLTPGKLRDWSAEALSLALPPMRMARNWLKPE